ncbi:MAG TPA: cysteine desulfurase family protein [Catalimonadaceae bacterium]|nr:cysteine desulfurase family protein [Catalimonadaceae bacterium]
MSIYLDNAATTPMDPAVVEAMLPILNQTFGNPSSIHSFGREAKAAVEKSRKKVADLLGTSPAHLIFTSGGTEADNMALRSSVETLGIRHAITSPLEHHAVLHTLEHLAHSGLIELTILECDREGNLNFDQLWQLMDKNPNSLVSLMHGNNEIGNLNPVEELAIEIRNRGGIFHCDTVQTVGHFPHKLSDWQTHFMVGSAHKFHGPKGIGFLYTSPGTKILPFIQGGAQERNMRGGTENVIGIVGLAKALELACTEMESHKNHISRLKTRMIQKLKIEIPEVSFNGRSGFVEDSLYTVLNVSLPPSEINEMLIFNLDVNKVAASGGSACSSGSEVGSHVLRAIKADPERGAVRFSFSRYNTESDIDTAVQALSAMFKPKKEAV